MKKGSRFGFLFFMGRYSKSEVAVCFFCFWFFVGLYSGVLVDVLLEFLMDLIADGLVQTGGAGFHFAGNGAGGGNRSGERYVLMRYRL